MPKKGDGLGKKGLAALGGMFFLSSLRAAEASMASNSPKSGNDSALAGTNKTEASPGIEPGQYDYLLESPNDVETIDGEAEEALPAKRKKTNKTLKPTVKPTRGRPTPPTRKVKATESPTRPTRQTRAPVSKAPTRKITKAPTSKLPDEGFSTNPADFQRYSIPRTGPVVKMQVELKGSQGNSYFATMGQERTLRLGDPIQLSDDIELGVVTRNAKVFVVRFSNERGDWIQYNYIAPPKELPSTTFPGLTEPVGVYLTCSFLSGLSRGPTNALFLHNALQPGINPKQGYHDRRPGAMITRISNGGVLRPYPWYVGNPRLYSDIGYAGGATYDFNVGNEKKMHWQPEPLTDSAAFNGQSNEYNRKYQQLFAGERLSVQVGADSKAQITLTKGKRDKPRQGRSLRSSST